MLWSSSSGRSILIADFSTLAGHAPEAFWNALAESSFSLQNARLADGGVVKNWKSYKGLRVWNFFFPGTNVPFFNGIFFSGGVV